MAKFDNIFSKNKAGYIDFTNIKKYPEEYKELLAITSFLPSISTLSRREWHAARSILSIPYCKYCDKFCNWIKATRDYSQYCSIKCANKDPIVLAKRAATNIKKYGNVNPLHNSEINEKRKATNLERYGVENVLLNLDIQEKIKATNLERYGVENVLLNLDIQEKIKATNLERYGVENVLKSKEMHDRANVTKFKKYGNLNNSQKFKTTVQSRYGVDHHSLAHIGQDKLDNFINNKEWLSEQHYINKLSLTEIANSLDVSVSLISSKFKEFNFDVIRYNESIAQKEINAFINQYAVTETNLRKIINPYEIDIFIPSLQLGIEFNGVLWHSENFAGKNKNYHLMKHDLAKNQNVKLIQIWSSEWETKKNIIKSRIGSALGINEKIFARKCIVQKISSKQVSQFLECNHLQGSVKASYNYGLFHKSELVAVMNFSKPRFSHDTDFELLRYCNKLNTNVVGGAGKLFSHFIKEIQPNSIVSYSDKRWGSGKLYEKLGFTFASDSPPNHYYFKVNDNTEKLYSRLQFQKHKLESRLDKYDSTLTAWENMQNNGFDRIWDCGNSVWRWIKI